MVSMEKICEQDVDILTDDINCYDYPELYDQSASLRRSNILIKSRYRATMLESKMLALTMYRCQQLGGRSVSFNTSDLKALLHLEENNSYIYSQLKTMAAALVDHKFYVEESRQKWAFYSFLEAAEYENGTMTLTLSEPAYRYLTELSSNYTAMRMPILLSYGESGNGKKANRQNFSLRIYELLKVNAFRLTQHRATFSCRLSLMDLKLTCGIISADDPGVREIIAKNPGNLNVALEKYVSKKENSSYARWSDFERRILRVAQQDMSKTDILMQYKPVRSGRGGRVTEVIFTISRNPDYSGEIKDMRPDITMVERVSELVSGKLRTKTILKILSVAGNDIEKIERAVKVANAQKSPIKNLAGFLIKAIQEEWELEDLTNYVPQQYGLMYEMGMQAKNKKGRGRKTSKNPFNNFEQNEYNFEQLELELLQSN